LRGTGIIEEFPNIAALMERAQARPAFGQALADQLSVFEQAKEGAAA
jgi:glutathione S-transferase